MILLGRELLSLFGSNDGASELRVGSSADARREIITLRAIEYA